MGFEVMTQGRERSQSEGRAGVMTLREETITKEPKREGTKGPSKENGL